MSDLTIYSGDDYDEADDLQLLFNDAASSWPDLDTATIAFECRTITQAGEVVTPAQIAVELTAEQTGTLKDGEHRYFLRATISGRRITLADGTITVVK